MSSIRRVFDDYCAGNKTMDGKHFAKLARDCGLLDRKLTPTEVDLTFSKIKDRAERRIAFDQFQDGVAILAKKKGVKIPEIINVLEKSNGRILYGTVAEPNKFHDDKSLYTGVYANGGPSTIDTDKVTDISQIMDRKPADVRGVKKDGIGQYNDWGGSFNKKMLEMSSKRAESRATTGMTAPCEDKPELRQVFRYYCEAGKKVMDSARLAKLSRDCGLLSSELTPTDVDLCFVKAKTREEKRLTYAQFLVALALMAGRKGVATSEIEAAVAKSEGPILYGTIAEPNKYHDDKSFYTGVHAFGGPSIIEDHKISDLSQLMDRTPADVRGVKDKTKAKAAWGLLRGMVQDGSGTGPSILRQAGLRMMSMRQLEAKGCAVAESTPELQRVFREYAEGGEGMRGALFGQLVKDTRLVDNKNLTPLDVDYTFNKVKAPGERRIGYGAFVEALQILSQKKKMHMEALVARIESAPGPPPDVSPTPRADSASPKRQSALLTLLGAGSAHASLSFDRSSSTPRARRETLRSVSETVSFWKKATDEGEGLTRASRGGKTEGGGGGGAAARGGGREEGGGAAAARGRGGSARARARRDADGRDATDGGRACGDGD